MEKLLLYLCMNATEIFSAATAAKELENISVSTIVNYIETLEMSNLIYLSKTMNGDSPQSQWRSLKDCAMHFKLKLFQVLLYIVCNAASENRGTCHDHIGTGVHNDFRIIHRDTAIHLDVQIYTQLISHLTNLTDTLRGFGYVLLSAKSRFHSHHQQHIQLT